MGKPFETAPFVNSLSCWFEGIIDTLVQEEVST